MLVAIIGWLFLVGLGLYCIIGGIMVIRVASALSGSFEWIFAFFIISGIALLTLAYFHCPFSITFS